MWKFSLDLESIMYRRYRQTNKILQPHFIGTLKKVKHCRKHTGADSLQPIWRFLVQEKKGKHSGGDSLWPIWLERIFFHLEESVVMCWSNSVKFSIRRKKKLVVLSASVRTTIDLCLLGGHHLFPKFVKTLNVAQKQRATVPVRTRHIHHFFSFQSFTFLFFSLIFLLPTFYFSQTVLAPPSSLNKFPRLVKG